MASVGQLTMSNHHQVLVARVHSKLNTIFAGNHATTNFQWWWNNGNGGGPVSHNKFTASLTGSAEVPSVNTNMSGQLKLSFRHPGDTGKFHLNVWNGDDVTAAHLHCAPAGQNGPVVVGLYDNSTGADINGLLAMGDITDSKVMGSSTPTGNCPVDINDVDDLEDAIEDGLIYVNVHTKDYPNGEIRGQVH